MFSLSRISKCVVDPPACDCMRSILRLVKKVLHINVLFKSYFILFWSKRVVDPPACDSKNIPGNKSLESKNEII